MEVFCVVETPIEVLSVPAIDVVETNSLVPDVDIVEGAFDVASGS